MKYCSDCARLKYERDFYPAPGSADGLSTRCKACALIAAAPGLRRKRA
jgi:hypothetical protein